MKTVTDMTHDLTAVARFVTDYARDHGLIQFDPKTKIKVKALGDSMTARFVGTETRLHLTLGCLLKPLSSL